VIAGGRDCRGVFSAGDFVRTIYSGAESDLIREHRTTGWREPVGFLCNGEDVYYDLMEVPSYMDLAWGSSTFRARIVLKCEARGGKYLYERRYTAYTVWDLQPLIIVTVPQFSQSPISLRYFVLMCQQQSLRWL
jgi:hypothetical protein